MIKAVVRSFFVSVASAPFSSSTFIISMSTALAARSTGVEPSPSDASPDP